MSVKIGYLVRRIVAWNEYADPEYNTAVEFYTEKDMPEEYLNESGVLRIVYSVIEGD
jgi:hypothetical protein